MSLINCPECKKEVSSNAKNCPNCGTPIDNSIKCPKCGSSNTKIITGSSKICSMLIWGIFSVNKVINKYQCRDCKHKF